MAMLKGIISKINGSAGNLTFMQTSGQTITIRDIHKISLH